MSESGTPEAILSEEQERKLAYILGSLDVHDEKVLRGVVGALRRLVERLTAERDEEVQWRIRIEDRVAALISLVQAFIDWGDAPGEDYSDLVELARAVLGSRPKGGTVPLQESDS